MTRTTIIEITFLDNGKLSAKVSGQLFTAEILIAMAHLQIKLLTKQKPNITSDLAFDIKSIDERIK